MKGEFGGQFYAVAVGLALLVVGLLMAALVCAKEIVGVEHIVVSYDGVGHAFWKSVEQVEQEEMPIIAAYRQTTNFLKGYYNPQR